MLDSDTLSHNSNLNIFFSTIELQFEVPASNLYLTVFAVSGLVGLILQWNSKNFEKKQHKKILSYGNDFSFKSTLTGCVTQAFNYCTLSPWSINSSLGVHLKFFLDTLGPLVSNTIQYINQDASIARQRIFVFIHFLSSSSKQELIGTSKFLLRVDVKSCVRTLMRHLELLKS